MKQAAEVRRGVMPRKEGEPHESVLESYGRLLSLGMLAAGVAHEMANPLGFVKSNVEYLQKLLSELLTKADPRVRSTLEEARAVLDETMDGVRRLVAITSELRFVSRARNEVRPCDIEQVLERAILLTHNITKYKADIERRYSHPPEVLADEGRLTQVFVNLLANAAQAIEGRGIITVSTGERDGFVEASVKDTGSGIPSEAMEKIFQAFYTTKPAGVGTGLGLWLANRVVTDFGGRIEVQSELGKGSVFRVLLPKFEQTT